MKYCKQCGKHFDDNYIFCPNCKILLEESSDISSKSRPSALSAQDEKEVMDIKSHTQKSNSSRSEKAKLHGGNTAKSRKKKVIKRVVFSCLAVILVICLAIGGVGIYYLNKVNQDTNFNAEDLGITEDTHTDNSIVNIALFGTDSRTDDDTGRSDALMILSIDKKHKKIKLTSIARDTYVAVEGHGKTKVTNAWRFGALSSEKSGSTLAVKTLNQNFNLDIKDYVEVNFFQFSEIIDYIGGVTVDVDESEKNVMNVTYIPYINEMGIKCSPITKTGTQLLSGGQALAYSRNRYTGSDVTRGSRQREVLIAAYEKLKDTSATKYPTIISMMLSNCLTSLSDTEILSLASWAALNAPAIEELSMPNEDCNASGQTINGEWFFVYDLDNASTIIHNFIYEPEDASSSDDSTSSDSSSSTSSSSSSSSKKS